MSKSQNKKKLMNTIIDIDVLQKSLNELYKNEENSIINSDLKPEKEILYDNSFKSFFPEIQQLTSNLDSNDLLKRKKFNLNEKNKNYDLLEFEKLVENLGKKWENLIINNSKEEENKNIPIKAKKKFQNTILPENTIINNKNDIILLNRNRTNTLPNNKVPENLVELREETKNFKKIKKLDPNRVLNLSKLLLPNNEIIENQEEIKDISPRRHTRASLLNQESLKKNLEEENVIIPEKINLRATRKKGARPPTRKKD